jgi:hypothetical protein
MVVLTDDDILMLFGKLNRVIKTRTDDADVAVHGGVDTDVKYKQELLDTVHQWFARVQAW